MFFDGSGGSVEEKIRSGLDDNRPNSLNFDPGFEGHVYRMIWSERALKLKPDSEVVCQRGTSNLGTLELHRYIIGEGIDS